MDPVDEVVKGSLVNARLLLLAAGLLTAFAPQDPPSADAVKAVIPSVVILTGKSGDRQIVATGTVIRVLGKRSLVLAPLHFVQKAGRDAVEATVEGRRHPAKFLFEDSGAEFALLALEGVERPPVKLEAKAGSKDTGMLVGAKSASEVGTLPFQMSTRGLATARIPRGILNAFESEASWAGAPAVNAVGAVIGFFVGGPGSYRSTLLLHEYLPTWNGLPMGGQWTETAIAPGEIKGTYRCLILDPESKVRTASLVITRQDLVGRAAAEADGGFWTGTVGSSQDTFPLSVKDGEASTAFTVKFALPEDVTFVGQVRIEREAGVAYGPPEFYKAPFSKTKAIAKQDEDWIEGKPTPGKGSGVESATSLVRKKSTVEDVSVIELDVAPLQGLKGRRACLSEDGAYLYVLGAPNLLRKIRTADLVEVRQLTLPVSGNPGTFTLGQTKAGLAFMGGDPVEVMVIDPESLSIQRKVFIAEKRGDPRQKAPQTGLGYWNPSDLITSPGASRVIVAVDADVRGPGGGQIGLVVDVGAGRIVRDFLLVDATQKSWTTAKRHPECPPTANTATLSGGVLTPDGRSLLLRGMGALHRFRITGSDPLLEEVGPALDSPGSRVEMSPDGRYVTLVNPRGHRPPTDHPLLSNVNFIYKVSNLQEPVAVLRLPEKLPEMSIINVLAFDREPAQLYLLDSAGLVVFDSMGKALRRVPLFDGNRMPLEVHVHPDGLKMAVITTAGPTWIEIPLPKK
jgi:hypothetical protein